MPDRRSLVARVQCPHCRTMIPQPFARLRVAVANTHVRADDPHGPRCRVIVVAAPEGESHDVYIVPNGVQFEVVMQRVLEQITKAAA